MADKAPKVLLRKSDGRVALVELSGGGRPPLHYHDFDETFFVLEGELTIQLGDEVVIRHAGELAFALRGVPRTYANLSGAPVRALLVITPAGFERYFARIAARFTGSEPPPEAAKPIPAVVTVGPPLGGADVTGPLDAFAADVVSTPQRTIRRCVTGAPHVHEGRRLGKEPT